MEQGHREECVSVRGGKSKKDSGVGQGRSGERVRPIMSGEIVGGRRRERVGEGGGGGEIVRLIVRGRG